MMPPTDHNRYRKSSDDDVILLTEPFLPSASSFAASDIPREDATTKTGGPFGIVDTEKGRRRAVVLVNRTSALQQHDQQEDEANADASSSSVTTALLPRRDSKGGNVGRPFLRHFPVRYHARVIADQTPKLVSFLLHSTTPNSWMWLIKLIRLLAFVVALLPGFIIFAWYYLVCDRVAVPYKTKNKKKEGTSVGGINGGGGGTSRHYLDIYGSRTRFAKNREEDGTDSKCRTSSESSFSTADVGQSSVSEEDAVDDNVDGKKPVVVFLTGGAWIIGYKMWGALLARALVPFGVLVIIPDYRNFPQVTIGDMINDVDESIQWVVDNCERFGGDPERIVLVGQSAGAHLGSCVLIRKAISEMDSKQQESEPALSTSYKSNQIKGFIAVSGPYNLVTMQVHFHRHGLDRNLVSALFSHKLETYSPTHMLLDCQNELPGKGVACGNSREGINIGVGIALPPICVIHGTTDNTVPYKNAIEFASCLRDVGVNDVSTKLYDGWSHTEPIIEAPMDGDHTFHRDVYDLVKLWTGGEDTMPSFDESIAACRRICPGFLIAIGRFVNPF